MPVRIPWELDARLQARAVRLGVSRSEAIRRAIDSWLVSEQPVRPPRNDFDLVGAVAMQYRCSRAEARVKVRLGEVMVNGQVEKRFTLPPGRPGQVYAITRTPNSTG